MINIIKTTITIITVVLAPFTLAIMISWNALPEDRFYPLKRRLEQAALKISSPSFTLNNNLQNKLIGRRINEASKSLSYNQSSTGLYELQAQIKTNYEETKKIKDKSKKQKASQNLISQLKKTKTDLIVIKKVVVVNNKTTPTTKPKPSETKIPANPSSIPKKKEETPIPTNTPNPPTDNEPDPDDVIDDIDDDIDDIIDDLENELAQPEMNMQELDKQKENIENEDVGKVNKQPIPSIKTENPSSDNEKNNNQNSTYPQNIILIEENESESKKSESTFILEKVQDENEVIIIEEQATEKSVSGVIF